MTEASRAQARLNACCPSLRSFSTFVAAVIRTLVGFYDISYSDGLAVCGAVAREMLSYGAPPPRPELQRPDVGGDTSIIARHFTACKLQGWLYVRLDSHASRGKLQLVPCVGGMHAWGLNVAPEDIHISEA